MVISGSVSPVYEQRYQPDYYELLTGPAAAFGPKRDLSSVEWVMKLLSKKKPDYYHRLLIVLTVIEGVLSGRLRVKAERAGRGRTLARPGAPSGANFEVARIPQAPSHRASMAGTDPAS